MTKILVTVQEQTSQANTAGSKAKDDIITIARIKATKVSWLKIRKGRRPGCHTFLKQSVVS